MLASTNTLLSALFKIGTTRLATGHLHHYHLIAEGPWPNPLPDDAEVGGSAATSEADASTAAVAAAATEGGDASADGATPPETADVASSDAADPAAPASPKATKAGGEGGGDAGAETAPAPAPSPPRPAPTYKLAGPQSGGTFRCCKCLLGLQLSASDEGENPAECSHVWQRLQNEPDNLLVMCEHCGRILTGTVTHTRVMQPDEETGFAPLKLLLMSCSGDNALLLRALKYVALEVVGDVLANGRRAAAMCLDQSDARFRSLVMDSNAVSLLYCLGYEDAVVDGKHVVRLRVPGEGDGEGKGGEASDAAPTADTPAAEGDAGADAGVDADVATAAAEAPEAEGDEDAAKAKAKAQANGGAESGADADAALDRPLPQQLVEVLERAKTDLGLYAAKVRSSWEADEDSAGKITAEHVNWIPVDTSGDAAVAAIVKGGDIEALEGDGMDPVTAMGMGSRMGMPLGMGMGMGMSMGGMSRGMMGRGSDGSSSAMLQALLAASGMGSDSGGVRDGGGMGMGMGMGMRMNGGGGGKAEEDDSKPVGLTGFAAPEHGPGSARHAELTAQLSRRGLDALNRAGGGGGGGSGGGGGKAAELGEEDDADGMGGGMPHDDDDDDDDDDGMPRTRGGRAGSTTAAGVAAALAAQGLGPGMDRWGGDSDGGSSGPDRLGRGYSDGSDGSMTGGGGGGGVSAPGTMSMAEAMERANGEGSGDKLYMIEQNGRRFLVLMDRAQAASLGLLSDDDGAEEAGADGFGGDSGGGGGSGGDGGSGVAVEAVDDAETAPDGSGVGTDATAASSAEAPAAAAAAAARDTPAAPASISAKPPPIPGGASTAATELARAASTESAASAASGASGTSAGGTRRNRPRIPSLEDVATAAESIIPVATCEEGVQASPPHLTHQSSGEALEDALRATKLERRASSGSAGKARAGTSPSATASAPAAPAAAASAASAASAPAPAAAAAAAASAAAASPAT